MNYIEIKDDLFDICKRIRQIDAKYFILFNLKTKKYEVHYRRAKNTYELTLPFANLDARAVEYVQKTRIEHSRQIYAEIEKQNQKMIEEQNKKNLSKSIQKDFENKKECL